MARRKKNGLDEPPPIDGGDDEQRPEQSNAAARGDTIRAAVRFIADRQAEIASIREQLNEYKQKHIKGDLGMKLADFAAVYRVSQLEVEDRDKLLDTLREGFAALGIGEQLDWVAAAETEDRNPTPPPVDKANDGGWENDKKRIKKNSEAFPDRNVARTKPAPVNEAARQAGRADGMASERTRESQWPNGTYGAADYELGYDEGVEQRVRASSTF